jgi:hypothetical protein
MHSQIEVFVSDSEEKYDRACRLNADGVSAIAREEKLLTLLSMQMEIHLAYYQTREKERSLFE